MAMELAAKLWGRPWLWHRRAIKLALPSLQAWVESKAETLECQDSYLLTDASFAQANLTNALVAALRGRLPRDSLRVAPQLIKFGNFLQDYSQGERAQNLEEAIACYRAALEIRTRESFPSEYRLVMQNMEEAQGEI